MISPNEASVMSICPSAPWWQLTPHSQQWVTIEILWTIKEGGEGSRLYMEEIPEILIHPQLSKHSPGGWCGQVYITAKGDLEVFAQEILNVRPVERLLHNGKASLFCPSHPSLMPALFTSSAQLSSLESVGWGDRKSILFFWKQGWKCKFMISLRNYVHMKVFVLTKYEV